MFGGCEQTCLNCEKAFTEKPSRVAIGKGKFCSRECYIAKHPYKTRFPKEQRTCERIDCGATFKSAPGIIKRYCSISCSQLDSFATGRHPSMSGKDNGRWGKPPKFVMYAPYTDRRGRVFRFRSSYEIAFVEQYLDKNDLTWDYESKAFDLGDTTYTPDFWVDELGGYVEVKGWANKTFPSKLAKFRALHSSVSLVVAYPKDLKTNFGLDLSNDVIQDIQTRFKVKSFTRKSTKNRVISNG